MFSDHSSSRISVCVCTAFCFAVCLCLYMVRFTHLPNVFITRKKNNMREPYKPSPYSDTHIYLFSHSPLMLVVLVFWFPKRERQALGQNERKKANEKSWVFSLLALVIDFMSRCNKQTLSLHNGIYSPSMQTYISLFHCVYTQHINRAKKRNFRWAALNGTVLCVFKNFNCMRCVFVCTHSLCVLYAYFNG